MTHTVLLTCLFAAALALWGCERRTDQSPGFQIAAAKAQLSNLDTALHTYEIDTNHFPTTSEGLNALLVKRGGAGQQDWHGPYLDHIPLDPWGNRYTYRSPGIINPDSYDLGLTGDGAKLVNVETRKPTRVK